MWKGKYDTERQTRKGKGTNLARLRGGHLNHEEQRDSYYGRKTCMISLMDHATGGKAEGILLSCLNIDVTHAYREHLGPP